MSIEAETYNLEPRGVSTLDWRARTRAAWACLEGRAVCVNWHIRGASILLPGGSGAVVEGNNIQGDKSGGKPDEVEQPAGRSPHAVAAERELALIGQTKEDPGFSSSLVAAIEAFFSYGHSGGSASMGIEMLHKLLKGENLAPITSDPSEWEDRSVISGSPLWQNTRNSALMSTDGGSTYFHVDSPGRIESAASSNEAATLSD